MGIRERSTDVLVVGAGPAGSTAAAWAAQAGHETLLLDAERFPRDKTCGDGLTPRAVAELEALGMSDWLAERPANNGVRMIGFGHDHALPWNGPHLPKRGSAARRTELDDALRRRAVAAGAQCLEGARAEDVEIAGDAVRTVTVIDAEGPLRITCRRLIVADGVRSTLGRRLGRVWHRDHVYGVAARAYIRTPRSDDPWITSHLELRDAAGTVLPGYGWIFPLGTGWVNVGVGSLATAKRPADTNLKRLLQLYVSQQRAAWEFAGESEAVASAMLPMGGAVSKVAGRNWLLIGDAAACVNPLNGEGIDYGMETGRLAAALLEVPDYSSAWPQLLQREFGEAFSIARQLGALLNTPWFLKTYGPIGMSSRTIMHTALRVMGNLVTDEDRDVVARLWRAAGAVSRRLESRPPWT